MKRVPILVLGNQVAAGEVVAKKPLIDGKVSDSRAFGCPCRICEYLEMSRALTGVIALLHSTKTFLY